MQASSYQYEPDTLPKFKNWLRRFFDENGTDAIAIWRAEGVGYANLRVIDVDTAITDELRKRLLT